MSKLTLILPALLGPLNDYDVETDFLPPLPRLSRWLARVDAEVAERGYHQLLLDRLFPDTAQRPSRSIAAFSYLADSERPPQGFCLRVDPVHLRVDRDHARLFAGAHLALDREQADSLIDAFNRHFGDDGLHLDCFHPDRWYLQLPTNPGIESFDLDEVLGRSVEPFAPSGDWAMTWQRWLTEAQMLLFSQPVNQLREEQGLLSVNSLWLWGGGELPKVASKPLNCQLYGRSEYLHGVARHYQLPLQERFSVEALAGQRDTDHLLLERSVHQLLINGDLQGWKERLIWLESHLMAEAEQALRSGWVDAIELLPGNGFAYQVTRSSLRRFWRGKTNLSEHFFPSRAVS